jgi:acyl-CoA reductase-like NAD-dependent aldehyde dehydrogenase
MDDAVERMIAGAFYQSGQSCIGVQRVLVHESLYEEFKQRFVAATLALEHGDPSDENTFIGPMISESEARRLHGWIEAAVEAGATLLCGGRRNGAMLQATLLEGVDPSLEISCKEAFGPVALLEPFTDFSAALARVNDSVFGLQTGIFTRDLHKAHQAWDQLEVGGVLIGDVPNWRIDHMPYGGVKESGLGREGIRWAIEDMTEVRLLAIRTPEPKRVPPMTSTP